MRTIDRLLALACAGALLGTPALAQIYRTTDEQGNVVFTDKPPTGPEDQAEEVKLNPLNTAPATVVKPRPAAEPVQREQSEPRDYELSITFPTDETTIPMGPGNFPVVASTSPPLREGELLQLRIDGADRGPAQASGHWELTNVFRGAHELTVQRKSAEGKVLSTSNPITVYVHRPSVNFNKQRNNPRPD